jgi:Tol biopolymer transport system component
MIDEHDLRDMLHRRANEVSTIVVDAPKAARRARRRLLANGAVAVLAAAAIAVATFAGVDAIRNAPIPADRSEELGIFSPVAGRIVYENETNDRLWAVNPRGPSDTAEGPSVADDVASTLVPLDLATVQGFENVRVLGWSSDGTELLFARIEEYSAENPFPKAYLYILHADGSETRLNSEPTTFAEHSAAISLDGTRVVFATAGAGVYVVDAEGGRPVRLPYHSAGDGNAPTFSPDGSQIAYLVHGDDNEEHVWVVDADGGNAHKILADEETVVGGVTGLQWSPAGDRLALGAGAFKGSDALAIYTFAPDGSDFTRVITGGISPYWSPDGSQIAYTILCPGASCPEGSNLRSQFDAQPNRFGGGSAGLAIADADGSNVREFGFAASGPWHPGVSAIDLTWSPDGSQIGVETPDGFAAIDADGPGEADPIAELTYRRWDGGSYSCGCA